MRVCKNCGQMMNDKTSKCPSCGSKIKKSHSIIIVGIVGLVLLVIMLASFSLNEYSNGADTNYKESMNEDLSDSDADKKDMVNYESKRRLPSKNDTGYLFYLGDTALYQNGIEITFDNINYLRDKSDDKNYELAEIIFTISNNGAKTLTFNEFDFSFYIDNMNQEVYYDSTVYKHSIEIAPSREGEISVYVDLSEIEEASTAELQYADSVFVLKNLDYDIDYTKNIKNKSPEASKLYSLSDYSGMWKSSNYYMIIYTYSDSDQIDIDIDGVYDSYISDAYFKDGEIIYNNRILYDYNNEETGETAHGTIFMIDDSLRWIDSNIGSTVSFKRYEEN